MRPRMLGIEQNNIRPLLGDDLFNSLKQLDQEDVELSDNETNLIFSIKNVIAYLTVSAAIPFLNIRMDANGITIMNTNSAQNDALAKRAAADKRMISSLIEACNKSAETWINNVTTFIAAHKDDFAEYLPDPLVNETQTPLR